MPRVSQKMKQSSSQAQAEGAGSQNTQRRRRRAPVDDDDGDGTQSSQAKNTLSKREMERKVADFVRYMLFMDAKKTPVKRADLNKNVLKEHTKAFAPVFTEVKKRFKKVFGYELLETEQNKQKHYMLVNKMQGEAKEVIESNPEDLPRLGLLMIILAIIFMKDNVVTEELLWKTLERLGVVRGEEHDKFGDVEKLVASEFVKQTYLDRKKVLQGDTAVYEYRWGIRAQNEITKRQTLEFVAQVYGTELEAWTAKYKEVVEEEEGDSGSD